MAEGWGGVEFKIPSVAAKTFLNYLTSKWWMSSLSWTTSWVNIFSRLCRSLNITLCSFIKCFPWNTTKCMKIRIYKRLYKLNFDKTIKIKGVLYRQNYEREISQKAVWLLQQGSWVMLRSRTVPDALFKVVYSLNQHYELILSLFLKTILQLWCK